MINEYKEFLEYTKEYAEGEKGESAWGRIPNQSIYQGIGLERALTIIARGFLYHKFGKKGNIEKIKSTDNSGKEIEKEAYSKDEALKRMGLAENYLKYWLTGDEDYIESLHEKSPFKPHSFKEYLLEVQSDSDEKPKSINGDAGAEVNNNKRGFEKDKEKINEYLNPNHTAKMKRLLELMDKHPDEELKYDESLTAYLNKEEIIKMLDSLLAKKTKKVEAEKEEIDNLKTYFSALDENDDSYKEDGAFKDNYKSFVRIMNKHKIVVNEKNIIIKTLKNLLKIIPADESEDRKDAQKLYDYFTSDEEKTKASYHLYNRFFFCTQYNSPVTYGTNFNFKSVILNAFHEGPLSINESFSIDKKTLNTIIKAMECEKGKQAADFIARWVIFIFVAAYCKSRNYQTEESFTYHPYVISTLDLWPKRDGTKKAKDGKGFKDLFNVSYNCDQYGEKILIRNTKQKYFGKDFIKIAVNKEILDGIKFVKEGTADTESCIVLQDCGINSYNESVAKLNAFYDNYKKKLAEEKKFLVQISKLSKKTKNSFFEACKQDIEKLWKNIYANVTKVTEKNKNQKGVKKSIVSSIKSFEKIKNLKANAESCYTNLIAIQDAGSSMEIRQKAIHLKNSIQNSYDNILQIFNQSSQMIEKLISLIGEEQYKNIYEEIKQQTQPAASE